MAEQGASQRNYTFSSLPSLIKTEQPYRVKQPANKSSNHGQNLVDDGAKFLTYLI